VVGFMIKL